MFKYLSSGVGSGGKHDSRALYFAEPTSSRLLQTPVCILCCAITQLVQELSLRVHLHVQSLRAKFKFSPSDEQVCLLLVALSVETPPTSLIVVCSKFVVVVSLKLLYK